MGQRDPKRVREEVPINSARDKMTTTMEENDDGFTKVYSRKKMKGADFGGIRLNKPKSKVLWQQKKGVDGKSNSAPPCDSTAAGGKGNVVLNTSNQFDVLNMEGDGSGEFGTQPKAPMDDLADDTPKDMEVAPKKTPRKTGIWSDRTADSPGKSVKFSPVLDVYSYEREDMNSNVDFG